MRYQLHFTDVLKKVINEVIGHRLPGRKTTIKESLKKRELYFMVIHLFVEYIFFWEKETNLFQ